MAQSPWDFNEQDGFPEWPATQPYVAPAYNPDDVPAVPKRPAMDDIFAQYDQKSEFSFSDEVIVAPSPKASAIEPEVFVGGSSSSAAPSFSPTPDVQSFSNVEIGLTGSDHKDNEDDTASSSSSSSSAEPLIAEGDIVFEISIPSHEVVGEGISSYVVYVVAFKTNLPGFKSTEGSIKRRYSDFVWLQDQLTNSCKGVIIPPLPDKAVLQTSKLLGNTRFDGDFVEYRRKELHRFLVRTSRHKTLRHSPFFASFLDVVDSAALVANRAEAEEKASRGLFSRNVKPQEVDLWFVDKGQYLASLSQNLDQLAKTTSNMLIKQLEVNQALSHVTDSSKSFATLESASSVTLSSTFNRLSQTSLQVAGIQQELCTSVASKVIDSIKDYHRLTASAQRILEIRLEKLAAFQTAHKELDQKSQKYKAGDAKMKAQVEAAEKQVSTSQEIFHTVSEVVRNEMEQFEASKSQELHGIVVELAQSFIDYELRAADLWKSLLNDLQ